MTLFVVLVFGAGAVLLISGWENTSLSSTIHDVWYGSSSSPTSPGSPTPPAPPVAGIGQKTRPQGGTGTGFDQHAAIVRAWVASQGR